MNDYEIRRPTRAERKAVRMLLPGVDQREVKPVTQVAVERASQRVVGASALFPWPKGLPAGFKFVLRVAKPYRGRGIGRSLVNIAAAESLRRRIGVMYAGQYVAPSSQEALAWRALGFDRLQSENVYELDPRQLLMRLEPTYEKICKLGWIPTNARMVSLCEAPARDVAMFHAKHLGGRLRQIIARINGRSRLSYDRDLSKILLVDDQVQGMMLSRMLENDISMVEAFIIAPQLRMGWANLLLKLHTTRHAAEQGRRAIQFVTYDGHRDTRQLAADAGARVVTSLVVPYRLLEAT